MNMITNSEYNKAYNNIEYRRIIKKASSCYSQTIPIEDLHQCESIALWEALQNYQTGRNMKFTSYLFKIVKYVCLRWLRDPHNTIESTSLIYNHSIKDPTFDRIDFKDSIGSLPEQIADMVTDRFYKGMVLREIAEKNKCSIETARRKINWGLQEMLQSCF